MLKKMKKIILILFTIVSLVSCDRFIANNSFNLSESKSVSVNGKVLTEKQKIEVNTLLNNLRSKSHEIYSKADFTIEFKKGSESKYISVFVKE